VGQPQTLLFVAIGLAISEQDEMVDAPAIKGAAKLLDAFLHALEDLRTTAGLHYADHRLERRLLLHRCCLNDNFRTVAERNKGQDIVRAQGVDDAMHSLLHSIQTRPFHRGAAVNDQSKVKHGFLVGLGRIARVGRDFDQDVQHLRLIQQPQDTLAGGDVGAEVGRKGALLLQEMIIFGAAMLIPQYLIGFGNVPELKRRSGIRIGVRMQTADSLSVGGFDILNRGVRSDPKDCVVILCGLHGRHRFYIARPRLRLFCHGRP